MNKSDKDARALQDATGARYMTCLVRVKDLRGLWNGTKELGVFMTRVKALPDLKPGQQRCVTCLGLNAAGVNDCECI